MTPTSMNVSVGQKLAIDGGAPVRKAPFGPWPHFSDSHVRIVSTILQSGKVNYWTGEEGRLFENEFAMGIDRKYAVAVANGTVALELALYTLGLGPGDEVIVPSRTFIASASSVVMRGAVPVIADVDSESQNITPDSIRKVISPRTRAVVVVHLGGWPCDMDPILRLTRESGLSLIEDCAQAQGAVYKGQPVGSFGDVASFSFCQDKIMTTGGEGGMLVTNRAEWREKAWGFKDHGKSFDAVYRRQHPPGFRWLHEQFGTNWRLTEMQSALGRQMLREVPRWIQKRRENAAILSEHLGTIPGIRIAIPPAEIEHCYYRYYAFVKPQDLKEGWDRDRVLAAINAEGVPCVSGACGEIYLEKAFPPEWRPEHRLPVARDVGETSLAFLVHPTLNKTEMLDTVQAVEKVMESAVG